MALPVLTVVIASTRPGRAGLPIGTWFADLVKEREDYELQLVDLAELDLPFLAEPHHPRLRQYTLDSTWAWSKQVLAGDAVVVVTPEYNYGYPATVKNAIDTLSQEWAHLPVGFVSYGGIAAGTRAVQQLKQVVTTLKMVPVFGSVNIAFHAQHIAEGVFTSPKARPRLPARCWTRCRR
ncbi:NADPH-dependent FMN reductase [Nocardioides alcanivorans]|uniref:NADPH-dependent FMN reductase n=1 Tax=Nocardioides alcanivorans TaxID=2897352 RepID=UPI001F225FE9|nr:NAD(P)H-dependent oxidoreductase [Nocardioides alcanivorans]